MANASLLAVPQLFNGSQDYRGCQLLPCTSLQLMTLLEIIKWDAVAIAIEFTSTMKCSSLWKLLISSLLVQKGWTEHMITPLDIM